LRTGALPIKFSEKSCHRTLATFTAIFCPFQPRHAKPADLKDKLCAYLLEELAKLEKTLFNLRGEAVGDSNRSKRRCSGENALEKKYTDAKFVSKNIRPQTVKAARKSLPKYPNKPVKYALEA
jgi:hypothetical protein